MSQQSPNSPGQVLALPGLGESDDDASLASPSPPLVFKPQTSRNLPVQASHRGEFVCDHQCHRSIARRYL